MDTQRKAGNELLAISHNANVSDGWMYPVDIDNTTGRPIDAAWAAARDRNERLIEIKQGKGQSETHPLLSPNDEFAGYELYQAILGLPANVGRVDHITGSFARQALKDGIAMQDNRGYNPYKFGMAGGSDSHNTGSPYRQDNFFGLHAEADGTVERRFAGVLIGGTMDVRLENPGGLTGVWAEENTRASIWDAMYRKETFGVSGPHIKVRFFGGWGYDKDILGASDWVKQSYAGGVPMGADLPPMPTGGKGTAPTFVVWAVKDPTSANLDRIQIIKGWTKNGQSFEKIFDVAWSGDRKPDKWSGRVPAIQSTVNIENATYENSVGSTELKTVWTDPEFDASLHAFYYARVLEIPTPRWTLIQAVKAGLPPPDVVPLTGQERAWSSPIWYTPSAEARKNAPAGMTVADLKQKGATALSDAELNELVVGKAFWVRNNVTGEQFSENFTDEGQMTVFRVGLYADVPSGYGNLMRDGYQGTTSPYKIEGNKLITFVSQDPYAVTFYKLGDTYYGARSNEFGYANYEIIPPPQIAVNPLTEVSDQFSIELGLTEQQKEQIVPILKEEIKQLEALKKDTSLSGLKKLEQSAGHRRLLRREDQAAAQCRATAEVPGNARSAAAADAREDGGRGRCQIGRYGRAALGEDEAGLGDDKTEVGGGLVGALRRGHDACNDTALAGRSVAVEVRGGRGVSSLHGMGPAIDGTAARLCPAGGAGGSDRGREPLPRDPGHQGGAAGGRHGRGRVPPLRSRFSRRGADERKALAARE